MFRRICFVLLVRFSLGRRNLKIGCGSRKWRCFNADDIPFCAVIISISFLARRMALNLSSSPAGNGSNSGKAIRGTAPRTRRVGVKPSGPTELFTGWTDSDNRRYLFCWGLSSFNLWYTRLKIEWYLSHSDKELCDWVGVSFEMIPSWEHVIWKYSDVNWGPWPCTIIYRYPVKTVIQNSTIKFQVCSALSEGVNLATEYRVPRSMLCSTRSTSIYIISTWISWLKAVLSFENDTRNQVGSDCHIWQYLHFFAIFSIVLRIFGSSSLSDARLSKLKSDVEDGWPKAWYTFFNSYSVYGVCVSDQSKYHLRSGLRGKLLRLLY